LRRPANQADRLEDPLEIGKVALELGDVIASGRFSEQGVGDLEVAVTERRDEIEDLGLLPFGGGDHAEQRIGDAAAGGEDDREAGRRVVFENLRDALHTGRVRDTRSAELVHAEAAHRHTPSITRTRP
jgi:hypothetical protein